MIYVFYDFETQQDSPMSEAEPGKFRHVANLCVLQSVCSACRGSDEISTDCKVCGVRETIFNSTDCVVNLLDYLVSKCNEKVSITIKGQKKKVYKFNKIIAIAYNMSGFDGQFILQYIYGSDRFVNPILVINGTKAIKISIGGRIDFLDSLNYFQVGLAKLPKLFGFEGTKGYYCHMFNIPANDNYVGPLPAKHFYCPESMTVTGRKEFDEWYDAHTPDYVFDNNRELVEYEHFCGIHLCENHELN